MSSVFLRIVHIFCLTILMLSASLTMLGQTSQSTEDLRPPAAAITQQGADQAIQLDGPEPAQKGLNFSEAATVEHDSGTGWVALTSSAMGYRFNDIFSIDATLPYYFYRVGYLAATRKKPNPAPHVLHGEIGDLALGTHAELHFESFDYTGTLAATVPTGDSKYGLSTGRPTFDLNNHFERDYGWLSPSLEVGIGDSSSLNNRRLKRVYTSLGILAFFQAGANIALPRSLSFSAAMYEQLPIGDQKVYTAGKRKKRKNMLADVDAAEDNGFDTALDMPLGNRFSLSAYYNRSFRQHSDIAGLTFTAFAKSAKSVSQ